MSQPANPVFVITSQEVADLFRSPLEIKRLQHFMTPEGLSTTAFAQLAGLTVNAAFRKVQKLEAQGLIRLVGEQKRAGRPVKLYACPYGSFFIPNAFTSLQEQVSEVFEPLLRLMQGNLVEALSTGNNPVGGIIFTLNERGLWLLPAAPSGERWRPKPDDAVAVVNDSGPLYLNHDDAHALAAELREVFDRYREKRGGTVYLMHQMLTPVQARLEHALPHAGYTELV